jgi:hypothetical protein
MLRAGRSAGIGADDKVVLMQSATTAQKAPVPLENKIEAWFADILGCRWGGSFNAAIDGKKRGVVEQRMERGFISSYPKYVRSRKVLETGKFVEGTSQKKRDLLPLLQEGVQETAAFRQTFLPVWGVANVASIGRLPRNKFIRDRVVAILIERES